MGFVAAGITCSAPCSSSGGSAPSARRTGQTPHRHHHTRSLIALRPLRSSTSSSSSISSFTGAAATTNVACRSVAASAASSAAPASLTEEQRAEWAAVVDLVKGLGFEQADADKIVARAFGWGTQAYWRREKVEEPPDAARAAEALRVLREDAGLSDAEVPRAVKAFPEVVGCAPAALRANLAKLRADWKLEGQVLAKAVARQPAVLGYTIDCLGDCAGECNRCWARF